MYAILGITGQVGGAVARHLLADGKRVRAVVRSSEKGRPWAALGCEVAVANIADAEPLTTAFSGVEGVFVMNPPDYDPEPDFPQTHAIASTLKQAITASLPKRVVFLSTVGAHVKEFNLLNNGGIMEAMLRTTGVPVALLRTAWFMENASWDVAAARSGHIASFLQPNEHQIAMVATEDIATLAAELLRETWVGSRVVELSGPKSYSPQDVANAFAQDLGHPVEVTVVPRTEWESLFRSQGMKNPMARIRMLDGFNEGWLNFEKQGAEARVGTTTLEEVIHQLLTKAKD